VRPALASIIALAALGGLVLPPVRKRERKSERETQVSYPPGPAVVAADGLAYDVTASLTIRLGSGERGEREKPPARTHEQRLRAMSRKQRKAARKGGPR